MLVEMRIGMLSVMFAAGLGCSVQGQVFHLVPGVSFSGMSDNGIAVGSVYDPVDYRTSMTWTLEGGVNRIGLDPVLTGSNISDLISGDGSTVFLGVSGGSNPGYFRYLGPGRIEQIVNTTRWQGFGLTASSFDGRSGAAVGFASRPGNPSEAGRWTLEGGAQLLGYTRGGGQSYSTACSSDGNIIVGWSSLFDYNDAFIWTEQTGMRILPSLNGLDSDYSQALGMSSDGRFIVGRSGDLGDAVIWRDGVIHSLGIGFGRSSAEGVSDDGSIIVGRIFDSREAGAFVWTSEHGAQTLADYFARIGVLVPAGVVLDDFIRVSPDGRSFYGRAYYPGFIGTSFVVTIPSPSPLIIVGVGVAAMSSGRRRSLT